MADYGITRIGNYIWDDGNDKWKKETAIDSTALSSVRISGITPVDGKLPVDTEITLEGDVIVQNLKVQSMPLTEVYPSGTFPVSGVEISSFIRLQNSDDLITTIQYNELDSRTTVSGITYASSGLGLTAYETFVSGTNVLTITRSN